MLICITYLRFLPDLSLTTLFKWRDKVIKHRHKFAIMCEEANVINPIEEENNLKKSLSTDLLIEVKSVSKKKDWDDEKSHEMAAIFCEEEIGLVHVLILNFVFRK